MCAIIWFSSFFKDGCPTKSMLYEDVGGLLFQFQKLPPDITGLDDQQKAISNFYQAALNPTEKSVRKRGLRICCKKHTPLSLYCSTGERRSEIGLKRANSRPIFFCFLGKTKTFLGLQQKICRARKGSLSHLEKKEIPLKSFPYSLGGSVYRNLCASSSMGTSLPQNGA